ncbi:MAG TPA: response regulator [Burkholderiales bacterium]|jgi:signal transduction histidine kinase/DNA-binding response OmpR family regulator
MEDKVNILVVDDLPDKRLAFQVVLEELGQNLVMAASGADALRELLLREFAVILLDVNMPDIDGIETAELIRQHSKTKHTPIIFVTAYADEMQTARGYALGAVDYILSPVIPEILRSKVKVFVELYRAQKRAQALARLEAERAAAEEATQRSEFLAFASRELGASLNLDEGMERLLQMLVPGLAEYALLSVQLEDEALAMSCGARARPQAMEGLEGLPAPLQRALREGRKSDLVLEPQAALHGEVRYFHLVPLRSGERNVAMLALGYARGPGAYGLADQATIEELVSRAAIAFENARLYWNLKREMARTKEAEEKLKEASRRKDEFLAMLSHELRNPLAPIRNAAEVMRRIAPTDAGIVWARDVVERQVTHLAQLVDDLLDVSRITQGKISLKKEPVELGKVVQHSVDTARSLLEAKRHNLSVSVSSTPIWVFGDFARLSQVIGNILNNAAKYTSEGGRIELVASAERGEALISVRDNGIGIDSALLPHVFELFTQGERSLDRSQGGLGVGLTVVERLVDLHQGRVEVHSEGIGKGSVFRVVLPCISEVPQAAGEERAEPQYAALLAGKRVLVVDDNIDAAESIAVFLRLEGHEVRTVSDGPQAVAIAQVFAPQVAVVDIGLPGMNGYEVARRLRLKGAEAPTLLIALTGYGQREDRARSMEAGFHHHFVKPADPRVIQSAIVAWGRRGADSTVAEARQ